MVDVPDRNGRVQQWHVLDHGPAHPIATLVCVHGNPTWSYLWVEVMARLGQRYRVIAPDQLGMGFSERTGPRTYADRVDDLGRLIDALAIRTPIIAVGQDWGGAVSLGWATAASARTAAGAPADPRLVGVVLCNTGIAVPAGRRAPWLIRLAATGPITDFVGHRTRIFVDGTIALSGRKLDGAAREALRAPYRSAGVRRAIAEFVADVPFTPAHPSAASIAAVAEAARGIEVPTLITWGSADPVFNDDFAHDLAGRIPHADLHRFGRAGHLSPIERSVADVPGAIELWLADRVEPGLQQAGAPAAPVAAVSAMPVAAVSAMPVHPLAAPSVAGYRPTWAALVERAHDSSLAYADGHTGATVSFAQLHDRVMGIARGLVERGLQPGDRVAVLVPPSVDLLAAVYGVWRAGGVTVVADRGLGLRGLGKAVRAARATWVIGPPQALVAAKTLRWAPGARFVAVGNSTRLGGEATLDELAASTAVLPAEPDAEAPAAVLYTSGATGPAKGVRYRHHQLAAQRDALATTYGITAADRLVAAFAPFALYGPALGIASTIPDVDVTRPGTLTADALGASCAATQATIVFASPAALANVVRTAGAAGDPRIAAVRLVLSAGAPVPVATLRAMARLCPVAELHTPYGMTECLPVADIDLARIDAAGTLSGGGVCVGLPVAGARVAIAPLGFDATEPSSFVSAGVTGEVLVSAPWLSDGYDQLWVTERSARPAPAEGAAPWHRSGDVGHLDHEGRLWIEGRAVHVVHTDAGAVPPVPVEVVVERVAGIERCAAVGVGPVGCQQLVVVVERAGAGADGLADAVLTAQVRAAAADAMPTPVAAVLQVRALPVDIRHNTKIDRTALAGWASAVLAGERARRPR